jgi:hypothetical protein
MGFSKAGLCAMDLKQSRTLHSGLKQSQMRLNYEFSQNKNFNYKRAYPRKNR